MLELTPWSAIQIYRDLNYRLKQDDDVSDHVVDIANATSDYEGEIAAAWLLFKQFPNEKTAKIFIDEVKGISQDSWPIHMQNILGVPFLNDDHEQVLANELRKHHTFLDESLFPDLTKLVRENKDPSTFDFRVGQLYPGALWALGFLAFVMFDGMNRRDPNQEMMFSGPNDEGTCTGPDGCEQHVGKVYPVHQIISDNIIPGNFRCLTSCRHVLDPVSVANKMWQIERLEEVFERIKHLPGKHQQLTHGGKRGPSLSLEEANAKVKKLFRRFGTALDVKNRNVDRLNQAFSRNGFTTVSKKDFTAATLHKKELIAGGVPESEAIRITDTFKSRASLGHKYQEAWEISSKNDGGFQDALQKEAFDRQGGASYDEMQDIRSNDPKMSNKHRKVVYDDIQKSTQKWFKDNGFKPDDELLIYRGIGLEGNLERGNKIGKDSFIHNPLSSWSFDKRQALEFADLNAGNSNKKAVTFAAVVKVKDIFSSSGAGIGSFLEMELVMESSKIGDMLVAESV